MSTARQLTKVGFTFACANELRRIWPDMSLADAAREMDGFAGVPVGTPGYDWSVIAARELANQYAKQFGEAA